MIEFKHGIFSLLLVTIDGHSHDAAMNGLLITFFISKYVPFIRFHV
jgi:hypothetical protein